MDDLIVGQNELMQAMEKMYSNYKKDGSERRTVQNIKRRLSMLDAYWQDFQNNHFKLCDFEDQSGEYFTKDFFERTLGFYKKTRELLMSHLAEAEEVTSAAPKLSTSLESKQEKLSGPNQQQQATSPQPVTTPIPGPSKKGPRDQADDEPTKESILVTNFPQSQSKKSQDVTSIWEEKMRKQKSNFKALARSIDFLELDSLSEKWEYEDVLRTLQARWTAIDSLHWEIDSLDCEGDPVYETTFTINERKFQRIKKEINSRMWSINHREKSTPQMDIPTFNGNFRQWIPFKDLFNETIHNNRSMSNAQKMQFLKSKVKGEAERLIQHLNISSENYQVCWDILNHRFNNIRLIFNTHINNLLTVPTVQHQSYTLIKRLHDTANESLNAIKNLGIDITSWDPLIVYLLSQKLDTEAYDEYMESLKNPRELPTLRDFLNFLELKFTSHESGRRKPDPPKNNQQQDNKKANQKSNPGPSQRAFANHTSSDGKTKKNFWKCPLCSKRHKLYYCKTFLNLKPEAKIDTVTKLKLCENCLYDHKGKECISEKRCVQCDGQHNTLLHDAYESNRGDGAGNSAAATKQINVSNVSKDYVNEVLLATAQIKVLSADGTYLNMRALIDQGSQVSLISENAAQRLGLQRRRCKGVIFGIGSQENNCKGILNITASSIHSEFTFSTDLLIMKKLVNQLPHRSFTKPSWSYLDGIQLADPEFNISRPIDILLGADIYSNILLCGIIKETENQPIAQQTRLGWILCGNVKSYQCNIILQDLDKISKFWTIEDIADNSIDMSSEDHYCLTQYKAETTRQKDGRYVVRLPLKPEIKEELGESKHKAVAQFLQLEKKFVKQQEMAKNYKSFITEYVELGHMRLMDECNKTPNYFLPHHCVQRADSTTTALRVVFNASAKTTSGKSLNDLMYRGPNLQADLMSLIMKWRQYKIAFTADIEKMFRQINCHPNDQVYQKIIWRNSVQKQLREYALTTVTYGTKAAPFLAMMTLKQLAADEGQKYPEAAKILEQDFYMDDLLSGAHSVDKAQILQNDLVALLRAGGFNLRKWCSNSYELLEGASIVSSSQQAFDFKHLESTKTLGLRWNPHEDTFSFQLKIETENVKSPTKRSLLSDISKIFDPLGWLTPVTTSLKLLFQSVWEIDLQWDDLLPESISSEWSKIKQDIVDIEKITVKRWIHSQEQDDIELHGFCDSSEKAYACVVYSKIYTKNQDGVLEPKITLIAGKSRLVPSKKTVTLPRLELCAALLLSKLMQAVQQSLSNHKLTIYGWSDSTAVLGWLKGDVSRWKPFVANRVQKITAILPPDCWRYVKSAENPADGASRGITTSQLINHCLWWQGPDWLPTYQVVTENISYETNQELKIVQLSNTTTTRHEHDVIGDILRRQSSFTRVTHILAWVLRAVSRCTARTAYLTVPEIKKANQKLVKYIQNEAFQEEISSLKQYGKVKQDSKLLPLNPFLDKNELLRVGGRIKHANIDENMRHPLIIPHSGHFTDLLIDQAHKLTFHGGARLTLAWLRQQYWILGGNRAVKTRVRQCVKCKKHNPPKQIQLMGDLPAARCNPTRPFYHTGVDYTGFIEVKSSKGRGTKTTRGYVAVFVCMVTKAVHLELVSDLTSSAFLAALRRLAARRGTPRHMYSDNGTNFVGANKILQQEIMILKNNLDPEFLAAISDMEIEWHFNAPSWPSAGGLWEAAVKSLKHHMRRVIGEQKLTYEEISTLLSQLEACLNARPLCALSEDPDDINYLTPSHFLASGPTLTIIETETDERTRWQLVQKIFSDIWKRWQSEYLCQLSARSKWHTKCENMCVGDIVIIHDAILPPGKWALGKIIDLHPGKDGCVRVVSIKTKNGVLKRPITKISRLLKGSSEENKTDEDKPPVDCNQKAEPKTGRGKRSCNLIIFATMLLGLVAPARCDYSFTGLSSNQSLYFDNVANMRLIKEDWNLIVYYDLDPYWQGLKLLSNCITNLQTLCAGARKQSQCDVVLLQLRHDASEIEYYNNVMLGQQLASSRQRRRRGLINGIGNLASTLFGVLDNKFAEQYENDINLIRDNQKHLALLWKNQTSVVEAEYNMLKRVEQTIEKQNKMLNQHINKLEMENNALTKQVINVEHTMEFTLSSMIATNILSNLKSVQEMLLETITDIHHGIFNVHLLHPEQLKSELNSISGHLTKDLAIPIDNIETDLQSIYHLLKVKARITKLYFIFEIKIPLVSRDNLEIYKLIAVPQQRGRDMVRLKPIADHLAINLKMDSYIPVTENELQNCIRYDSSTYLCHLQTPVYYMQSDKSLCIRDQNADQCETERTTCKETWTQLYKLNMYLYFCCDHCKIKIMCQNQIEIKQFSNAGVITLGNGCILKSDKLTIVAHRQQSNQLRIKPNLVSFEVPPINNIVNLTIPTYESKNTLNDTSSDLQSDLRVIGKQIEQMKVSEVNGVLADRVTSHDVHQFIVLYILLGAFLVAGALLTWRRLRKRFGARLQPLQPPSPPNERPIPLTAQYAIPNVPVRSNTDTNNHNTAIQAGTSSTRALDRRAKAIITKKRYI